MVVSPSLGAAIDLGSSAVQRLFVEPPLFVQWGVAVSDDGAAAAIADIASARTVVVSFTGAEPFVVPGIPLGFSEGRLVTRDRGSTAVTVRYFEVNGRAIESFSVDAGHRLALLEDGVLIALAESGAMFRVSAQQPLSHASPGLSAGSRVPVPHA